MKLPLQLLLLHAAAALDDGLCRTPIMGMNSWTAFGASVTEADLLNVGKFFVTSGLREKGCLSPANLAALFIHPAAVRRCPTPSASACLRLPLSALICLTGWLAGWLADVFYRLSYCESARIPPD